MFQSQTTTAYNAPGMRRVPRPSTAMVHPTPGSGGTLQWRTSPHAVVPKPAAADRRSEPAATPDPQDAGQHAAAQQAVIEQAIIEQSTEQPARPIVRRSVRPIVQHVAYNHDQDTLEMRRNGGQQIAVAQFELPAPLGDQPLTRPRSESVPEPIDTPENSLRSLFEVPDQAEDNALPLPGGDLPPDASSDLTSPLGDMMRQTTPQSPSDVDREETDEFDNPFDDMPLDFEDDDKFENLGPAPTELEREQMELDRINRNLRDLDGESSFDLDDTPGTGNDQTCEQFRQRLSSQTIDQVSLDISPPYRPDEINFAKFEKLKARFEKQQPVRTFRNIAGEPLATGRFRDIAYGQIVLQSDQGEERIDLNEISEADLAYVTSEFGLPNECLLPQQPLVARQWTPTTFTWKASNQCHNPLYFQDVNLERYGHTHGPIAEPLIQTAHFFGSVLVLPYKMGVHHPRECIYTLGYYRPGNCAPWILPAVPISARGILNQAAVMTGGTLLIP